MISVIIPTFNREKTIIRSITSVLNQSYTDIELIVIDDGSTDCTRELIERINDKRIIYVYQNNSGACVARNKGISLSRGDYIAFHDSDDVWHNKKLEHQINTLIEKEADIVICQSKFITEQGIQVTPKLNQSGFLTKQTMPYGIGTQTFLMKKEVAQNIKFDSEMLRFQDLEWLIRAIQTYSIYGMKEVLVDYSISDDAISRSNEKMINATLRIMDKHPDIENQMPLIGNFLSNVLVGYGTHLYEIKDASYKDILQRAYTCSNRKRDKVRSAILKFGLYPIAYIIRKRILQKR